MSTPAKIVDWNLPTVALVGRVNVGKSTLFNRLTESTQALVSDTPGTTRTRNSGQAIWRGKKIRVVDTGGLTFSDEVLLEKDIIKQTEAALKEANVIVFVTDIRDGLLPQEKELAKLLLQKKKNCPIIFVANKADNPIDQSLKYEQTWLKLGFGAPMAISAQNGSGLGELMEEIFKHLKKNSKKPKAVPEINPIKVALIGKPNVGKSSLFNKLIGEDRVIVSDMPHTTREPHDTLVEVDGQHILFVDTAGIRRKAKVGGHLERQGIGKSIEAMKRADIVLFLLDTTSPITDQDQQLGGLLRESTKSVIIVVNKWDLSDENTDSFRNSVKEQILKQFPHIAYAPIVFVSAATNYRVHQIFPLITRAYAERQTVIDEDTLQEFIKGMVKKHLPSRGKGVRHPQIKGFHQINAGPPIFELFIKYKTSLNISYVHFLENRLREQFSFFAAPIIIKLTKTKRT
ncbi:MAG: ribosome biogenesis GTPase Der [Candidatus Magasanikbacteria bacterium]|nr:ribosome biogenesis GTPase Der [Candidatus Magasanikbacteria bacterium]